MNRRPLLAGNWKMNKTVAEAVALAGRLKEAFPAPPADRDVLVFPPFTALAAVARSVAGSGVGVGAQDVSEHSHGAFTGEISPSMLKDAGATHVLVGHSERRQYHGETDALVRRKAQAALAHGLIPVVCLGESLVEREAGRTFSVLTAQAEGSLEGLGDHPVENILLAYEPVWAIGTGRTATPEQAQEVHAFLRDKLKSIFGEGFKRLRILYGGSVTGDTIAALMAQPDVDGGLVGGASLAPDEFIRIVRFPQAQPTGR
jgi:triosephosphate isomerase